jgi:hypothetical protein
MMGFAFAQPILRNAHGSAVAIGVRSGFGAERKLLLEIGVRADPGSCDSG